MIGGDQRYRTTILAPTRLEYWATRSRIAADRVQYIGISGVNWTPSTVGGSVCICGFAGSFKPDLDPGSIFIPEQVGDPDGQIFPCDQRLTDAMRAATRDLGFTPHGGTLFTARSLVTGNEREERHRAGFTAGDMETAIVARSGIPFATVRVILDSPDHPISNQWLNSAGAMANPRLWSELLWMAAHAPQYALRAAAVVRGGLMRLDQGA